MHMINMTWTVQTCLLLLLLFTKSGLAYAYLLVRLRFNEAVTKNKKAVLTAIIIN